VIVPGMVTLLAVALAAGIGWAVASGRWRWARWPVRLASALVAVFLLLVFVSQSLPLRQHHEFAGSFELTRRVARAAGGRQGVFLWQQVLAGRIVSPAYLFGGPLDAQEQQVSALLPLRPDLAYVRRFTAAFPGQPVFLLWAGSRPPAPYASLALERVDRIVVVLPTWQESETQRPSHAGGMLMNFSVWHLKGT
jgi:hypothetical protein